MLVAILVVIGASLPNLRFDDDINRVFLSDSALSDAQRSYEAAQDPPISTVIAYVRSAAPMTSVELTAFRDATLEIEFIDGVVGVVSPFILRMSPDEGAPNGQPVFPAEILPDYGADIGKFRALGTGLPIFINDENTALLITVTVDLGQTKVREVLPLLRSEIDGALSADMSLVLTGEDAINLEIVNGLKGDLLSLNIWGALLVAFAALVLLQDLRMVLLAVVPAVCGAVSVLALSVWLGYPITVLSNVIPILLLVLGVADGVHLAGDLKTSKGDPADTVRRVGPACALTALTTAAAFASVMLTGNAQLFEFALLGAVGTVMAFAMTITAFALLAMIIRPSDRPIPQFASRGANTLAEVGSRFPKTVILASIALLCLSVAGYLQTTPWFPLYQNLPDNSTTVAANDAISKDFGGVFRMIVEVYGDWEKTRTLSQTLSDIAGPDAVLSEVNFARWLGTPDTEPSPEQLATLPIALIQEIRPDTSVHRIFVSIPEPMRDEDSLRTFDALYAAAAGGGADRIIGLPTIMRFEAVGLISELSRGLLAAAIGATLIVALAFRSLRLIPVLALPNLLPLMITGASLHLWARGELTPTAVLALTIAFGIAIDDTVHFISRYSDARSRGEAPRAAVALATRDAGQVMVLTTILLSVGLCVTLASGFFPIRLFGGMMIVTLLVALVFDLLLLPALLSRKDPFHDSY
ncbi:hypothetical protein P775_03590 [Puniceibacterium antarcticum]|uniref:SSD domain-containing protein n=1 Tax=Puniceibacterium antarcticum TaxID=1206336 RepID=A0A2G8RJ58_9RHOB|nr:MMPL family transporter [Puniceibacterium antarcticum]PIL21599.1 hypothetical protein P775_03590 [Puniceibacterium antarcticum]